MVFKVEGLSGNIANVNSDNNLTVALPLDETEAGYGKILSEVDAGDYLGTRNIRRLKTSRDFRLRTGFDTILFNEYFSNTILNTSVWTAPVTTSTVVCANGFVTLNDNASVASAAVARLTSYRTFPVIGPYGVYFEIVAKFNSIPIINNVTEWGAGICTGTSAPTDGVFFRLTATGELKAIMNYNGTEVMSPPLDFETLIGINTTHVFVITATDGEVKYWIDDILVAVIDTISGAAFSTSSGSLPLFARTYNVTAVSIAQKISIGQVSVTFADIVTNKPIGHNYSSDGSMAYEYPSNWGSSIGQTAQFAVSANPTAATPTQTTAALGSGLGGVFLANVGGVNLNATDGYVICSYQVPKATKKIPGQTLYITGIKFDVKNEGATNAANPLTWQVIAAYGKSDAFDPLNVPDIRGYWTAEEVILNGSNVVTMPEIANLDSNMDVTQANTSLQPAYLSNGINGMPVINFNSNKYLASSVWTSAQTQPATHYSVYKPISFSSYAILVDGINASNRNAIYNLNGTPSIFASVELQASSRPLVANENIIQCSVFDSVSNLSKIFINNYSTASATGNCGTQGLTGIQFGVDPTAYANSANAYLACHYVFSGLHDEATRKRIMEFLSLKYSIPVTGTATAELTTDTDVTKVNRLINLGVQSIAASAVAGEQASPTVFLNLKEGPIVVQQGEYIQLLIKFINFTDTASQALWCYATFTGYWE